VHRGYRSAWLTEVGWEKLEATSPPVQRVVIADGDPLARAALGSRLEREDDFEVVGEAATDAEAIEVAEHTRPDVLLVDNRISGGHGVVVTGEVATRSPSTRVILIFVDADEETQLAGLRAGAVGSLSKEIDLAVLPRVLRGVRAGEAAISRTLTRALIERINALQQPESIHMRPVKSLLTQREWEVLDLLAQRASTVEIASELQITEGTVRAHVKHILAKLGLHSRAEAVEYMEKRRHPSGR
jgi:NarL family two-component system response regulator LiaR